MEVMSAVYVQQACLWTTTAARLSLQGVQLGWLLGCTSMQMTRTSVTRLPRVATCRLAKARPLRVQGV